MYYVEAPKQHKWEDLPRPFVFLAGGTGCPDWQQEAVEELENLDFTLFNPRRANFDITDESATQVQIAWEFARLQEADLVAFWFAKETIQPIVLFELGFFLGKYRWSREVESHLPQAQIIGIHPEYPRIDDVQQQTMNVDEEISQLIVYSFKDFVQTIRQGVEIYREMENESMENIEKTASP